jgi:hypothetical protein
LVSAILYQHKLVCPSGKQKNETAKLDGYGGSPIADFGQIQAWYIPFQYLTGFFIYLFPCLSFLDEESC